MHLLYGACRWQGVRDGNSGCDLGRLHMLKPGATLAHADGHWQLFIRTPHSVTIERNKALQSHELALALKWARKQTSHKIETISK